MPSTDETMERLKQRKEVAISEIGYLKRELEQLRIKRPLPPGALKGRQYRLNYIERRYCALDIESLAIQREAEALKKA